jgi:cytochrome c-type biogenesis protein CcmH/NrfG
MTAIDRILNRLWTRKQAVLLAVVCLMAGVAGGWLIRGAQNPADAQPAKTASLPALSDAEKGASPASQMPAPDRLKQMADAQAAPLLAKLQPDPNNPDLLAAIGNVYYDARQYPIAAEYYGRALQARPSDAAVRTDMATAYWYMGNADLAIAEFNKALVYQPDNPNTLFNLGLVKWKGKMDSAGAVAAWQKLMAANPHYERKDEVEQMMADVKKHTAAKPGMNAK